MADTEKKPKAEKAPKDDKSAKPAKADKRAAGRPPRGSLNQR